MAFADQNGKITIDEIAAEKDIKTLQQSKALLEQALDLITQIELRGTEFHGDTGERVVAYSSELNKDIKQQLTNIETTITAIKTTVARYQRVDQNLKEQIQGSI